MFVEFQAAATIAADRGVRSWAYMLDYVMTGSASSVASRDTALATGATVFTEWSTANPGGWTRRSSLGDFTAVGNNWTWSQPCIGMPDQAFYHKGFGLVINTINVNNTNYFNGYMGAFQDPASRTNFAPFDFARPLNWAYTSASVTGVDYSVLNSPVRFVHQDRYVMAAAEGYMFVGNIDQGTFWAVVDGTALPIHQFATSSAIPMLGLTGAGDNSVSLTRHDLRVHVHKYDSGAGESHNQLSSFSQQLNGDSTASPSATNFLNLYPSSLTNRGFLDRFDVDGKRSTALYPIIIGNPIRGNAYQTTEGLLLLSGQNHATGQTFYVGSARYYKFVCSHDRANRAPAFAGLVLGIPVR